MKYVIIIHNDKYLSGIDSFYNQYDPMSIRSMAESTKDINKAWKLNIKDAIDIIEKYGGRIIMFDEGLG